MTNQKYILKDKKVIPVDLKTWARWFETADRHVGLAHIGDVRISTVFMGIDHNFDAGEPLLFETMIFGGKHDQYQERYATYEEAEAGHEKATELVKQSKKII